MRQFVLVIVLMVLFLANIFIGSVDIPFASTITILCGGEVEGHAAWNFIVLESRLPQAVAAMLCGAGLGTSGLLLQTVFRNPLAGPSILGIDSGANLAVAVVVMLLGGTLEVAGTDIAGYILIIFAAMAGAMAVMCLVMVLSSVVKSNLMLLICGVMISYMASSVIQLLQFHASQQGLQVFTIWGMGGFTGVTMDRLPVFVSLLTVSLVGALLLVKSLDALLLGDNYAQNLGINTGRIHRLAFLSAGLAVATTTAFCGPVTFLGLAVPHIARLLTRESTHRTLLPATILLGSVITLACNLLCCMPVNTVLPINIITPLIGAPVVLWIVFRPSYSS